MHINVVRQAILSLHRVGSNSLTRHWERLEAERVISRMNLSHVPLVRLLGNEGRLIHSVMADTTDNNIVRLLHELATRDVVITSPHAAHDELLRLVLGGQLSDEAIIIVDRLELHRAARSVSPDAE